MVVTIGPGGGVVGAVGGAAGVVMDGGLVVEVDDVEGAIGADARMDGAEPEVGAGDELGFFAAWFLCGDEGDAVRFEPVILHEGYGGVGGGMGGGDAVGA